MGYIVDCRRGVEIKEDAALVGVEVATEAHGGWSKGWLAKLSLPKANGQSKYDLEREFINSSSNHLSRAGNGSKRYESLDAGVYEADSVYRSYSAHRTYFEVKPDGSVDLIGSSAYGENRKALAIERLKAGDPKVTLLATIADLENKLTQARAQLEEVSRG